MGDQQLPLSGHSVKLDLVFADDSATALLQHNPEIRFCWLQNQARPVDCRRLCTVGVHSTVCRRKTGCHSGYVCLRWCVHLRIRDIHIPRRIRKRKIHVEDLVESIAEFGLLQPIIVDTENTLIAGYRRLEAARALGWESIDVRVIDAPERRDRLLLEIEENSVRQDFDREELERARTLLRRYERTGPVWKAWNWLLDLVDRLFKA